MASPPTKNDRYLYARVALRLSRPDSKRFAGYLSKQPPSRTRKLAEDVRKWKRTQRLLGQGKLETRKLKSQCERAIARCEDEIRQNRAFLRILTCAEHLDAIPNRQGEEDLEDLFDEEEE